MLCQVSSDKQNSYLSKKGHAWTKVMSRITTCLSYKIRSSNVIAYADFMIMILIMYMNRIYISINVINNLYRFIFTMYINVFILFYYYGIQLIIEDYILPMKCGCIESVLIDIRPYN